MFFNTQNDTLFPIAAFIGLLSCKHRFHGNVKSFSAFSHCVGHIDWSNVMKKLLLSLVTVGTLGLALAPTTSMAQVRFGFGVGDGYGYGDGYYGDGYGYGRHRWHHRHHCRWIPVWHHHHRVLIKQCWGGWGGYNGY